MTTQQRVEAHETKLVSERAAWFAAIRKEAEARGLTFKVTSGNRVGIMQKPDCEEDCSVFVEAYSSRHSYDRLKTYNRIVVGQYSKKRLWRKLDAEAVVTEAIERIDRDVASALARKAHREMSQSFAARQAQEMSGLFMPPGMEAKIIASSHDTNAGKYYLDIASNNPLKGPWTVDQLRAIQYAIDSVAPSHPFRVGRKVTFELERVGVFTPHTGVIVESTMNSVTVALPNPLLENSHHHENIGIGNPTLKLV